MKVLLHTLYRRGRAGLSNLVMSLELGVVLAKLTERVLIVVGNDSPSANVVRYEGLLDKARASLVTDLFELPLPWLAEDAVDLAAYAPYELFDGPAWDSVFYWPSDLSLESEDLIRFAGKRRRFVTVDEALRDVPALAASGGPDANMLSFYSTFFYLDAEAQRQAFDALRNLKPKRELADLAARVARDLEPFNAVHVRRGDFKLTYGTTTLDRTGEDVVKALEPHFERTGRLVLLTDEADDPVFDALRAAYTDLIVLDRHILQDYRSDFLNMPAHDSIALALLSQLVAAESSDFVGTMASTFTSMIQRMRGNRSKEERFKFLWNELPEPGDEVERGRHAISDCVPLNEGVMIETGQGPYSWNRVNDRLNTGWMREWPESFLHEASMVERTRGRKVDTKEGGGCTVSFLGDPVAITSNDDGVARTLANLFEHMSVHTDARPVAEVRLQVLEDSARLLVGGKVTATERRASTLLRRSYREVVTLYIDRHPELVWLHAGCAETQGCCVVFPGDWGRGKSSLVVALHKRGWSYLSDDVAPVDVAAGTVRPFPATPQMRAATETDVPRSRLGDLPKSAADLDAGRIARESQPLSMVVLPHFRRDASAELVDISPGEAVGELLTNCLSFTKNEDATVQHLCAMVEDLPVQRLVFGDADEAAQLLIDHVSPRPMAAVPADPPHAARPSQPDIAVEVMLSGGVTHQAVLPADSQILHDLHVALAAESLAEQPDCILQLPVDGGQAAVTFMASSLVSLITRPPVLVTPQATLGRPTSRSAPGHVVISDFLTPAENALLLDYAVENEAEYQRSTTIENRAGYRRSKVFHAIKESRWKDLFVARLKLHLPHIAQTLGKPGFRFASSEIQLTASNDGDYFKAHADSSPTHKEVAGREITFVYYLHRTPRPYSGGGLLFYEGVPGQPVFDRGAAVSLIDPQNNCLIAFASERWHEVDMVRCPSGAFADSRFTVNGWLWQDPGST